MAFDEAGDEERPRADVPLPPEDRLWRHPSEVAGGTPLPSAWPTPTPPPSRRGTRAAAVLAGAGVAGALVVVSVLWLTRPVEPADQPPLAARSTTASFTRAAVTTDALAQRLAPTLVQVKASHDGTWRTGTGLWLDTHGTIAVATPVVDGAGEVVVTDHDGAELTAQTGGADAATGITILTVTLTGSTPVAIDAVDASTGEDVVVIAAASVSPGGGTEQQVVTASVSAVGMRTTVDPLVLHDAVQLDRAVPDAAAGSIVVDADGNLVGIVLDGSGADDLAVVVPADDAMAAARGLRDDGEVRRAWLGVRATDLRPEAAELLGIDGGAELTRVQAGSPAAAAGLLKGDVITQVDDQPVADASDLVVALRQWQPGEHVVIHWQRGPETGQTEVTLGG